MMDKAQGSVKVKSHPQSSGPAAKALQKRGDFLQKLPFLKGDVDGAWDKASKSSLV